MAGFGWHDDSAGPGITTGAGNLTASRPADGGGGTYAGIRGYAGKRNGKRYFEINATSDTCCVGLVDINADIDGQLGNGSISAQWGFSLEYGTLFYRDAGGTGTVDKGTGAVAAGLIGILVDLENQKMIVSRNGAFLFSHSLDFTGGEKLYPAVSFAVGVSDVELFTVEPFNYLPSLTYVPWDKSDLALGSKVSGTLEIEGSPASRVVKVLSYDRMPHSLNGQAVTESRCLGETVSDPITGEYEVILREAYSGDVIIFAFDDYGASFNADASVTTTDRIHPTIPNGYIYECTGSGALPSVEPDPWPIDTELSHAIGTASFEVKPFYRPQAHAPVTPEAVNVSVGPDIFLPVIAQGNIHTVAIALDGTVSAWGTNTNGATAVPVDLSSVKQVAAGENHSLALKTDGTVVAWGLNNYGQCNTGLLNDIAQVAAGNGFSVFLKKDGTIFGIGNSANGRLPNSGHGGNFIAVSAGQSHTLALRDDGTVLALGTSTAATNLPVGLDNVVQICAGYYHSYAVKSDGTAVGWGANNSGSLNTPAITDFVQIAIGASHTIGLRSNGSIARWGTTTEGLGSPPSITNGIQITAYRNTCQVLRSDGTVLSWGRGSEGQKNTPIGFVALLP